MIICLIHKYTHTHSIISITFLLSCILCALNTNTHYQPTLSEPLYSQTDLSACSWVTIGIGISDNVPIYRLWNSSKGPCSSGSLWCVVFVNRRGARRNTLWRLCVTECMSHGASPPAEGIWGRKKKKNLNVHQKYIKAQKSQLIHLHADSHSLC